jgi:hypothetical protein
MKNILKLFNLCVLLLILLYHTKAKDYAIIGSNIFAETMKTDKEDTTSNSTANKHDSYFNSWGSSQKINDLNGAFVNYNELPEFWINLGLGASSAVDGSFGPGISFNYNKGLFLASLRLSYSEEFKICVFGPCSPPDNNYEFAALSGIAYRSRYFLASITGGLSYVFGDRYYGNTKNNFQRIGLPIDTQLFFRFSSYVGIGIEGFANINSGHSFAGALFCLQIGDLR